MRVWIGCLASYNNGRLHGEWFDVSTDADENAENIAKVLRSSPYPNVTRVDPETGESYATAEEACCADYEGPRALVDLLGEYPGAATLAHAARLCEALETQWAHDDEAAAALSVMLDGARQADLEGLADNFEDWISDHFAGEADTLADFAEQLISDHGTLEGVPDELARYFDYEAYGRDMQLGGDITTERVGGKLLVFWNR